MEWVRWLACARGLGLASSHGEWACPTNSSPARNPGHIQGLAVSLSRGGWFAYVNGIHWPRIVVALLYTPSHPSYKECRSLHTHEVAVCVVCVCVVCRGPRWASLPPPRLLDIVVHVMVDPHGACPTTHLPNPSLLFFLSLAAGCGQGTFIWLSLHFLASAPLSSLPLLSLAHRRMRARHIPYGFRSTSWPTAPPSPAWIQRECIFARSCVRARVLQGPQMSCLPLFDPFHLFDFFAM